MGYHKIHFFAFFMIRKCKKLLHFLQTFDIIKTQKSKAFRVVRGGNERMEKQEMSKGDVQQINKMLELIALLIEARNADTKEAAQIVRDAKIEE